MTISSDLKEIYATPSQLRYIETLELRHPDFTETWYIANDSQAWDFFDAKGGTSRPFKPLSFEVKLPKQDNSGSNEMSISIVNAGLDMMDEIEAASQTPDESIHCTYRIYLAVSDSEPQIDPPIKLTLTDLKADLNVITATASRFDFLNREFPRLKYNAEQFPGLDR